MKNAPCPRIIRILIIAALATYGIPAVGAQDARITFLEQHCLSCHSAKNKKGGLDLEALGADLAAPRHFETWVKVHDKVKAGEMPPVPRRQPSEKDRDAFLSALRTDLAAADIRRQEKEGRSVLRRLTRREYENTLRDLLDLPGLNIQDMLPEDGRAFGFDKVGTALDLSSVQLSKYLWAADLALEHAIATQPKPPERLKLHIKPLEQGHTPALRAGSVVILRDLKASPDFPIVREKLPGGQELKEILAKAMVKSDSLGILKHEANEFHPAFQRAKPPLTGFYNVRISLWGFLWNKGEVLPSKKLDSAALFVAGTGRQVGYFDAPSLKPTVYDVKFWMNAGEHIRFNAATLPRGGPSPNGRAAEYVGPGIAIDWFEVEGPIYDTWPAESHRRLFGDLPLVPFIADGKLESPTRPPPPKGIAARQLKMLNKKKLPPTYTVKSDDPEADAQRLLAEFLPRAFRRPVAKQEINRYLTLVHSRLKDNVTFEEAMRTAYKAALCSTNFLYLEEPVGRLDDFALASRLSYFLWNTMPDRALYELAEKGQLKNPATLRTQVERMLGDARAERFVVDFLDQWLELRDFDVNSPDKKLYPEFGPFLRDAMLGETQAYFRELLHNNLGVRHVVASDFAMLNNRMAQHYKLPEVVGSAFRKVPLPPGSHRGGLLTQASVLRVTANGTTTSPVKRGAWVMRQILGQPPAAPPPDVPAVEPDVRGAVTIRELLDKHRTDRTCAACHAKIDPPGFALENFDVIGGWRQKYRSLGEEGEMIRGVHYRLGLPVDASGATADGRAFKDFEGFQKLLLQDERLLARNLASQLTVYATGAPIGFADRDEIEKLLDRAQPNAYGIRSLIHEVVQSSMFQRK